LYAFSFEIKNKIGTMSSHKSESTYNNGGWAITLRSLLEFNMAPFTVTTIMKNADKSKKTMKEGRKTATILTHVALLLEKRNSYSHCELMNKMKETFPTHEAHFTIK
jgi:hypothetical protein